MFMNDFDSVQTGGEATSGSLFPFLGAPAILSDEAASAVGSGRSAEFWIYNQHRRSYVLAHDAAPFAIEGFEAFQFFCHTGLEGDHPFAVTEQTTGCAVGRGSSRQEAKTRAVDLLRRKGIEAVRKQIKKRKAEIKRRGASLPIPLAGSVEPINQAPAPSGTLLLPPRPHRGARAVKRKKGTPQMLRNAYPKILAGVLFSLFVYGIVAIQTIVGSNERQEDVSRASFILRDDPLRGVGSKR